MWVDLIYTLDRDSMFGKGEKQVLHYLTRDISILLKNYTWSSKIKEQEIMLHKEKGKKANEQQQ